MHTNMNAYDIIYNLWVIIKSAFRAAQASSATSAGEGNRSKSFKTGTFLPIFRMQSRKLSLRSRFVGIKPPNSFEEMRKLRMWQHKKAFSFSPPCSSLLFSAHSGSLSAFSSKTRRTKQPSKARRCKYKAPETLGGSLRPLKVSRI